MPKVNGSFENRNDSAALSDRTGVNVTRPAAASRPSSARRLIGDEFGLEAGLCTSFALDPRLTASQCAR